MHISLCSTNNVEPLSKKLLLFNCKKNKTKYSYSLLRYSVRAISSPFTTILCSVVHVKYSVSTSELSSRRNLNNCNHRELQSPECNHVLASARLHSDDLSSVWLHLFKARISTKFRNKLNVFILSSCI